MEKQDCFRTVSCCRGSISIAIPSRNFSHLQNTIPRLIFLEKQPNGATFSKESTYAHCLSNAYAS